MVFEPRKHFGMGDRVAFLIHQLAAHDLARLEPNHDLDRSGLWRGIDFRASMHVIPLRTWLAVVQLAPGNLLKHIISRRSVDQKAPRPSQDNDLEPAVVVCEV